MMLLMVRRCFLCEEIADVVQVAEWMLETKTARKDIHTNRAYSLKRDPFRYRLAIQYLERHFVAQRGLANLQD